MWTDEYGELDDDDETMFEFANAMLNTLSVLSAFHFLATRTANTENPVTSQSASVSYFTVPLQILRAHPSTGKPGDQNAETRGDGKTSCVENCEELRAPRTVSAISAEDAIVLKKTALTLPSRGTRELDVHVQQLC